MERQPVRVRVVFDCMIFLQGAARRESPAGACLDLAEQGQIDLCISASILAEVVDVLSRPRIRAKFTALTDEVVAGFVEAVQTFATLFVDVPRTFALDRDPKDESYLNLACHSGAAYLVTRDNDLLHLAAAADGVGQALRERFPRLQIIDPLAFLTAIRDVPPEWPGRRATADLI